MLPGASSEPAGRSGVAEMTDEIVLTQSRFTDEGTVGFGVVYIMDADSPAPQVQLATVDFSTNSESTINVRCGDTFQVAGETWQLSEVRKPAEPDWAVVLRRVSTAG
jgi:Family of unknown function (DUF6406)